MVRRQQNGRENVTVFVDTNIYLDFYRAANEATLQLLSRLKKVEERIICTYQVEMEFLKNRQNVLLGSIQQMKSPTIPSVPAIFKESKTSTSLHTATKEVERKTKLLKERVTKLLDKPSDNDEVYLALEGVFQSASEMVLTRDMPERQAIKRKALRRFLLGYPPRKLNDTSYGDALNWEWIIHVANKIPGKVVIVSRDCDFGCVYEKAYYVNDQLRQEYRDRVGKRRPLIYTQKLSDGLKLLDVKVSEKEIEAEEQVINFRQTARVRRVRRAKPKRVRRRKVTYFE